MDTREDLGLNRQNMQTYIDGPIYIKTMLLLIEKEVQTSSKILYLDDMEAIFLLQPNTISQFRDTIEQYQSWHQYVTERHQV